MKKISNITFLLFLSFLLSSCLNKNTIEENQIPQNGNIILEKSNESSS
jgi:PBP1b-binding outer membrane lipoprotein LpoB